MSPIALPKGGGAIRGVGEKFFAGAATGTMSLTIPLPFSPGRNGMAPQASLAYDSGFGNGVFGYGWNLAVPSIARKVDRGVPRYADAIESDTFLLSGSEDLVPVLIDNGGTWIRDVTTRTVNGVTYTIAAYRPRIEGLFARIERWTTGAGATHWRTITPDNVTSLYGTTSASRIADPADPLRVFSWLLCETFDDRGHAIVYEYVAEDSAGIAVDSAHERNRTPASRSANRYLKRVRYGNQPSRRVQPDLSLATWLFTVVFDYGEAHVAPAPGAADRITATLAPAQAWPVRQDPFSSYRAGFEVRTYRLCRRVLMFHHFPAELGVADCLVRSTSFVYRETPTGSFLETVTQSGHVRQADATYTTKSLPTLDLQYGQPVISQEVKDIDTASLENLPNGLDLTRYQWVDLDGEGISGVLSEQADRWMYKPNLGNGVFGPPELVAQTPALLGGSRQQLLDFAGDGQLDVATLGDPISGFHERTIDRNWSNFRVFASVPVLDWADPNLRLVDLTGDGRADVLQTLDEGIRWYPSLGEEGFGVAQDVGAPHDDERGPRLVFADARQSIFLTDMSGDGSPDLVRISNGEIAYWPNLGYGRFGAKVTMDGAPVFDDDDQFDRARLHLADIDGTGVTDIVYAGRDGVRAYFNQSGNGWSAPRALDALPRVDSESSLAVLDLLGTGTACLVWSSPLPSDAARPMRYVDLMGGAKPHLLVQYTNGAGKRVRFEYRSSSLYYLQDKQAGTPWATRLPFPVQCVSRVVIEDLVREVAFTTTYTYHHGYFDGVEREFRGFARVEQQDTETFANFRRLSASNVVEEPLHQPPVLTRTWFHTGADLADRDRIVHQLRQEYYVNAALAEYEPPDAPLPGDLANEELREALRACKGQMLRQEVYALDGTGREPHPYKTVQTSCRVQRVQPAGPNRHASFLVSNTESIGYQYERKPDDPRIEHTLVLEIDAFGRATKTAGVFYPRRLAAAGLPPGVADEQARTRIVYAETDYTNDVTGSDVHRLRVPCEVRTYELAGVAPPAAGYFSSEALRTAATGASVVAFEQTPGPGAAKRLIGRTRSLFLRNDLSGPLPLGQIESLGLGHRSFELACTAALASAQYGAEVTDAMFLQAGYVHSQGDPDWWSPSGTPLYAADAADHFYLVAGARDPLGSVTTIERDAFDLLPVRVIDPLGLAMQAENDYRTLNAWRLTDVNLNRSAVETDELGLVVKVAHLGKPGAGEGDTLADPTARLEYDLGRWQTSQRPVFARTLSRERHGAGNPRWQERYVYLDGDGEPVMTKIQAEPGLAKQFDEATGTVTDVDTSPAVRWVGTGRTVLDNKGNVVKAYEPYFSVTHEFENARALVDSGVTSISYYDPLGRNIRTERPDGALVRIEFDPWEQRRFDANDTVLESAWYADRGSPNPLGPEPAGADARAAWLAAQHAGTPAVTHGDSLGRPICGVADNGSLGLQIVRTEADITGHVSRVTDPLGREVSRTVTNVAGTTMSATTAEKGTRWVFTDVLGNSVKIWDAPGRTFLSRYDALHRPIATIYREPGAADVAINCIVYGETSPTAAQDNLRGRAWQVFDQTGLVRFPRFDFKGNSERVERRFAREFRATIDWSALVPLGSAAAIAAAAEPALEPEVFFTTSGYDALNRPVLMRLPDGTIVEPVFNEANSVDSLRAQIRGQGAFVTFLVDQDYDAKGLRLQARFGNGTVTRYTYDPKTFRIIRLFTKREADGDASSLQDISLTYDAVGNLVRILDGAQQTHYFANAVVAPENRFEYDALYQLIAATGREHAGIGQPTDADAPVVPNLPHVNDASAVRPYTQRYEYDAAGNLLRVRHVAPAGSWTRHYRYAYQDNPADRTNRLAATSLPGDSETGPFSATYTHDTLGNMTAMPHLASLTWNALDQLKTVDLAGGGTAHYVYGNSGQRLRKVVERPGGLRIERLYLGAVEVRREWTGAALTLERWTVHIADDNSRIASVDTKTIDVAGADASPLGAPVIRYLYANHLGSVSLTTDAAGMPVSYEEYHPFGSTSYRASQPSENLSLKPYRYTGKERDDETGLQYFGARYYAPWLGRWTSADPGGFVDGLNMFRFVRNNPINGVDPTGRQQAPLNPAGEVSWEVPASVFLNTQTGRRYSDAVALQNMQQWLAQNHPDRPYTAGTLSITRWVQRTTRAGTRYRAAVFNAEWLDGNGRPVLPRRGESGFVTSWGSQPRAEYGTPGDASTRTTENEHTAPRAQERLTGGDEAHAESRSSPTTRSPRNVSLDKTAGDNAATRQLQQRVNNGGSVNYVEDVVEPSRQRFQDANNRAGQPIRPGSIDRGTLAGLGYKFEETPASEVGGRLPAPSSGGGGGGASTGGGGWSRFGQGVRSFGRGVVNTVAGPGRGRFWGGVGVGVGAGLARGLIPGYAEAELFVQSGGLTVARAMLTTAVETAAAGAAAAPVAAAATAVVSAAAGYVVGDFVESHVTEATGSRAVGVGAGTLAGAATGAAIGAAIGTIVPGLGTAAGAIIGGVAGGIAGFIGSYW